ncbi:hypothetical protein GOP47_0027192 [Adiantum capillus-veneris]|nr:hypothetical protein GOP47_0027192 [Adiantum capillus-veneris]
MRHRASGDKGELKLYALFTSYALPATQGGRDQEAHKSRGTVRKPATQGVERREPASVCTKVARHLDAVSPSKGDVAPT